MANEDSQSLSLKVLVDEETNRVVFAESDNDFVDVLFSFMTMPIGNIIRLTDEQALKGEIGCLNNLYESIENLDDKHLQSVQCKDMLLRPRSAAEIYCRNLKLDFVNSGTTNVYYACRLLKCPLYPYRTAHCHCGRPINCKVNLEDPLFAHLGGVFVKPASRFMITDDLQVLPMSTMTCLTLLKELGAVDGCTIKERCINMGKDEVLKLLKCSLTSMAPFSECILESPVNKTSFRIPRREFSPSSTNETQRAIDTTRSKEASIALKLIINKCNNRALYAEAEKDFVDLICSFLTIPLGYFFHKCPSLSLKGCLGNIYKSIKDFDVDKYLKSEELKATLVDPKLAPGIAYSTQLILIQEALHPSWSTVKSLFELKRKKHSVVATIGEGFMKEAAMFMVTDNLSITPLSPISGLSLINKLNIPINDIVEREVTIGEEEALRLLEAALVSTCALTDAFLMKEPKQEPQEEMKATLVDPKLAPGIAYSKKLILIEEALYPSWSTVKSLFTNNWCGISNSVATTSGEGYMKGPFMFMVTDNLSITPLSPISSFSLINKLNIPIGDIVEQEVTIDEEEALRLLEAALASRSALTNAFILRSQNKNHKLESIGFQRLKVRGK